MLDFILLFPNFVEIAMRLFLCTFKSMASLLAACTFCWGKSG
jgi:hypothetical protein